MRSLDKCVPTATDIDQYKMIWVDEHSLKTQQQDLDLISFPDLFPSGCFGEHHPRDVKLSFSDCVKCSLFNSAGYSSKTLNIAKRPSTCSYQTDA